MLEASVLLFLAALARRGELAAFSRHRDGLQAIYMMMLILVFSWGFVLTLTRWP